VQPVVLRPVDEGYELIAGERRWRAAQLAGMHEIPAVIRDIPDQAAAAMSLIENIQREDLNAMEEANALQRLINEFGLTHQQTADSVGRSRAAVSNLLRLLELTEEVKAMVDEGELEMGHGRALLALAAEEQIGTAKTMWPEKGMSVRETERLVKRLLEGVKTKSTKSAVKNPDVARLESDLGDKIGAPVSIQYNTRGKGKLVIEYNSLDELDGILDHIK
jgi:ParB family chromosome partitioning protein